ncbi:uncharacterized protein B0H64DRAFT_397180 [Chaetomium fimeti]|uniref:Uncharacterized protein n=1 Tax=Chaetomium fimeti TaxID=1854472 RepID=A0AAE0HG96_9PEZI|nr:hypothetical protein B0H64DRAFT_397180 [Chaetomium fimeti]
MLPVFFSSVFLFLVVMSVMCRVVLVMWWAWCEPQFACWSPFSEDRLRSPPIPGLVDVRPIPRGRGVPPERETRQYQ